MPPIEAELLYYAMPQIYWGCAAEAYLGTERGRWPEKARPGSDTVPATRVEMHVSFREMRAHEMQL